ncbi:MAG: hypothetical protein LBI72_03945 [Flavobacteriaceae bacterium]|jgi:hypothetical protein|nr:hypothetical protein [Flavobacteriaceae bacterium]
MKVRKITPHLLSTIVVAFFIFIAFGSGDNKKNEDGTPKTEKQIEIEKHFSAWDGSHIELTQQIKQAMNDPDSYEHIETKFWDVNDHLVIRTVYSGKNAFGGRVKNAIKVKATYDGKILEVIEEGM